VRAKERHCDERSFEQMKSLSEGTLTVPMRPHANSIRTGSQSSDSQVSWVNVNVSASLRPATAARRVSFVWDSKSPSHIVPLLRMIFIPNILHFNMVGREVLVVPEWDRTIPR